MPDVIAATLLEVLIALSLAHCLYCFLPIPRLYPKDGIPFIIERLGYTLLIACTLPSLSQLSVWVYHHGLVSGFAPSGKISALQLLVHTHSASLILRACDWGLWKHRKTGSSLSETLEVGWLNLRDNYMN
jgi:hypothetical protein